MNPRLIRLLSIECQISAKVYTFDRSSFQYVHKKETPTITGEGSRALSGPTWARTRDQLIMSQLL